MYFYLKESRIIASFGPILDSLMMNMTMTRLMNIKNVFMSIPIGKKFLKKSIGRINND